MKKIITLLLLIGGFACAASAAKLYVNTSNVKADNNSWWTNVRIYAYNSDSDNNGWYYSETGVVASTTTLFGKDWYVFDMGNYANAIVQYFETNDHSISHQSTDIIGIANDRFVILNNEQQDGKYTWYENGYTFRCNVLGNWNEITCNMTVVDEHTLSYTLTKSEITGSGVNKIWFRILNQEGQIYPNADGFTLSFGSSTSDYYNNWTTTGWSFGIEIPSYDYEKIVVTASLSGSTWTISADAYVSVTTNAKGYSTFNVAAPLTISDGATAYYATDKGNGSATAHAMTNPAANVPMLIKGDPSTTYSFAVAASGTTHSDNAFKAGTGSALASTTDGKYNYILNGDAFYAANDKTVALGKAYLQLSTAASARALVFADDEATGIEAVDNMPFANDHSVYNLNGQRVNTPQEGLYIVNGRKVVLK